ncbi:MAG: hypothetical protein RMJ07_00105 [Nitrososphaerota archaeon]|nr:hypothetical protein [Candidatus Bathyarchaeota archaeon]MDW8048076.1 hypothetical protein [Nitrososphaerota archaeon]
MKVLKRIRSLFRIIAHRSPTSTTIKACPRCGSVNIKLSSKLDAWLIPTRYICLECGYIGPLILEIEKKMGNEDKSEV